LNALTIFEFSDELSSYLAGTETISPNDHGDMVLALRPSVQAKLKELGIPFRTSYDYFDRTSHETLVLKSEEILQTARKRIHIDDDIGIKEGYNNAYLFYMRCFVHYLLFLIEVIDRCVGETDSRFIVAPHSGRPKDLTPLVGREYRYIDQVAALVSRNKNIALKRFGIVKETTQRNATPKRIPAVLEQIMRVLSYEISAGIIDKLSKGKRIVCAPTGAYNMASFMSAIQGVDKQLFVLYLSSKNKWQDLKRSIREKSEGSLWTLPETARSKQKQAFMRKLNATTDRMESAFASHPDRMTYRGIDFSKMVFERIRLGIHPLLVKLYSQTVSLERTLKRYRPAAIFSPHSREISYNLGELGRKHRIPSLLVSHGSHVPPKNRFESIEWREHGKGLMDSHYDYVAVQTPWAKAYREKIEDRSQGIVTGPLIFAKRTKQWNSATSLRQRMIPGHEDKFVVLQASTPKTREVIRFCTYETVDEYIRNINDLIEAVAPLDGVYLIIRFRPLPDLSEQNFAHLVRLSDNAGIHSSGTFEDYLNLSDLLVSYSSTTIEEALQNDLPVLQYDPQGKYYHVSGTHIDPEKDPQVDSCYFVDSKPNLQ